MMRVRVPRRVVPLLAAGALAAGLAVPASAQPPETAEHCHRQADVVVPGAEKQQVDCLDDLTTAGTSRTGHTDSSDYGPLSAKGTVNPTGVPGIQVDGYFPDTSTFNPTHGWFHDSQFVIRLPDHWNGGLVVTGAPGIRKQYANDFIISDWVLAKGYAYASTDKGNNGVLFYRDGATPGDAVVEWNARVTELARAAKQTLKARYGRPPGTTIMTGISNGGYLTRWQLENHPELYDAGVDWEGTLFTAEGQNLFRYLPTVLREYPRWKAGVPGAAEAMYAVGMPRGSEFLWDYHEAVYWDLTQRTYREEFDPDYDGPLEAGIPYCQGPVPGCDASYDIDQRPQARAALSKVALTGKIQRPMVTLHGTLDALLPPATDSDVYTQMIASQGKARLHRYYVVEQGNHVDSLYDDHPDRLRPILPCYRKAFEQVEAWIGPRPVSPPPSGTIPADRTRDVVNTC